MNTDKILRPEQLHFAVPDELAKSINNLIAAIERDDRMNIDAYLDDLHGAARMVSLEHDMWIRDYYVNWGWLKDD